MENQITVSELISGMRNIVRMREEIELVVDGLIGRMLRVLRPSELSKLAHPGVEFGATYSWTVVYVDGAIRLICYPMVSPSHHVYTNTSRNGSDDIKLEEVAEVHFALRTLVDGLLRFYPVLANDVNILRSAAAKQF